MSLGSVPVERAAVKAKDTAWGPPDAPVGMALVRPCNKNRGEPVSDGSPEPPARIGQGAVHVPTYSVWSDHEIPRPLSH